MLKRILNFFLRRRLQTAAVLGLVLALSLFLLRPVFGVTASQVVGNVVSIAVSPFLALISTLLGAIMHLLAKVLQLLVNFLVQVARYDNFATSPAIANGWVIVRDLANMAIVVGLLYIAFANALGKGKYSLDQALMRLVGVAILVNFSKTITLLLVDVSQVVMLTFVNSFKDIGSGNFTHILGIDQFMTLGEVTGDNSSIIGGQVFNIILMLIVCAVLVVMMGLLIVRLVSIWLFIVLSPIAFVGLGVPFADKIWNQWWTEFQKYLLIGPCLAFFIWLTFITMQNANTAGTAGGLFDSTQVATIKGSTTEADLGAIGTVDNLAGFLIAVAMLLGGTVMCSKLASGIPGVKYLQPGALQKGIMTALRGSRDVLVGATRRVAPLTTGARAIMTGVGVSAYAGMKARSTTGEEQKKFLAMREKSGFGAAFGAQAEIAKKAATESALYKFGERKIAGIKAAATGPDKGLRMAKMAGGFITGTLSGDFLNKGVGSAVKATTFAENFFKEPGTLARGAWRRVARGEKGSFQSAMEKTRNTGLKSAQDDIKKQGRSQAESKQVMKDLAANGRPDLTQAQRLAEFLEAIDNGALNSPEEKENAWKKIKEGAESAGENMQFYTEQEGKWRKSAYDEKSIFRRVQQETDENGNMVAKKHTVEKTLEKARDYNELNQFSNENADEVNLKWSKGKDGRFNNKDETFQVQKAALLGRNELMLAGGDSANKERLRVQYEDMLQNADLTEVERQQAETLLAATYVDGAGWKDKTEAQKKALIDDVKQNKSGDIDIASSMAIAEAAKSKTVEVGALPDQAKWVHDFLEQRQAKIASSQQAGKLREVQVDDRVMKGLDAGKDPADILEELKTNEPAFDIDDKTWKEVLSRVMVKKAQQEIAAKLPDNADPALIKKEITDYIAGIKNINNLGGNKTLEKLKTPHFELQIKENVKNKHSNVDTVRTNIKGQVSVLVTEVESGKTVGGKTEQITPESIQKELDKLKDSLDFMQGNEFVTDVNGKPILDAAGKKVNNPEYVKSTGINQLGDIKAAIQNLSLEVRREIAAATAKVKGDKSIKKEDQPAKIAEAIAKIDLKKKVANLKTQVDLLK